MRYANRLSVVDRAIVAVMLLALVVGVFAGVKLVAGGGGDDDPPTLLDRASLLTRGPVPTPPAGCFVSDEPTADGPVAPSDLTAEWSPYRWNGGFRLDAFDVVNWTDNADEETCFVVEMMLAGGGYEIVIILWANAISYSVPWGPGSRTYRVYAADAEGRSAYSNEDSISAVYNPPTLLDAMPLLTLGPMPTWNPIQPGGFSVPTRGPTPTPLASVHVSGVVIPIPEGARYFYGGGPETIVGHWLQLGDSTVIFDDYGLEIASIEASDEQMFEPTLDAIWTLTQKVGMPSPPTVVVNGVYIPLPEGSYYSRTEAQAWGGTEIIVVYKVRFEHSVLGFNHWPPGFGRSVSVASNVRPGDEARFQPTLDALDTVTAAK